MIRTLRVVARIAFVVIVLAAIGVGGFIGLTLAHFGRDLPDYKQLTEYVPATGTKVYADDGKFMAEFETEHRIPVAIAKVPRMIVQAFLAAEDRDFYTHNGVNPGAIFRAAMADVLRLHRGQRPMGASTITQQVVRHFLLSNEVSVARKIKEAMLAYRIEKTLSKDRILEIYLNEIYLGAGSYGVAAAADTYFQKPLDQLTLAEAAFLAALPKAPNNYNPIRHAAAAKARRDWVLAGMAEIGWITAEQVKTATAQPLGVHLRTQPIGEQYAEHNGYFTEEVRRELVARFGDKAVYQGGLTVRTSYTASYQEMAEAAFRKGLVDYDRRHGWRGPLAHLATGQAAQAALATTADPPGLGNWQLAAVVGVDNGGAMVALKNGGQGRIPLQEMTWARRTLSDQRLGASVRRASDVVNPGDIVLVEPLASAPAPRGRHAPAAPAAGSFALRQLPDISGAVVVMHPKNGRILAMVGGWSFQQSQFNRATQAKRQPGSSFKPFVYVTALENGFTPESAVDDSPVEIPQGPGQAAWSPGNYEGDFVGMTTLEDALVHSRNLATVHVAMQIGMPAVAKTVSKFDVMDKMPLYYSMALGAGETTPLRMTTAYSMLDNGGHWLLPSVIDMVQDRDGRILYQKGVGGCAACFVAGGSEASGGGGGSLYRASGPADPSWAYVANAKYAANATLYKPTKPDPLVSPTADAEIISMMQGVVERGTGIAVAAVGKPIAGKTGTTSDWFDAWFVGFSPDLAAGVFVGFDDPRTLGNGETGGHVAAPIFRDFMMAALKDKPATPFPVPPGAAPAIASAASANTAAALAGTGTGVNPVGVIRGGAAGMAKSDVDVASLSPDRGNAAIQDPDDPDNDAAADRSETWRSGRSASDRNGNAAANQRATQAPPQRWPGYDYGRASDNYAAAPGQRGWSGYEYAGRTQDPYPAPPPAYAAPQQRWSGYNYARPQEGYAAAQPPSYPAPWASGYAAPSYGSSQPYRAPQYLPPGWGSVRSGTGGLY